MGFHTIRRATHQLRWQCLGPIMVIIFLTGPGLSGGDHFPVSKKARREMGTTGYFTGKRQSDTGYRFISGSSHAARRKMTFHFRPLCVGEKGRFAWRVFYDRSLEGIMGDAFPQGANETWRHFLGLLQAYSASVFGTRDNALNLWVYLVPLDATYDFRADRRDPDQIPLSFYVPCPVKVHGSEKSKIKSDHVNEIWFEDQFFNFIGRLAHEYAHTQIAVGGMKFPNTFSEEVAAETFAVAFMGSIGESMIIRDETGQPLPLPVIFPDTLPRDRDGLYFKAPEMCYDNLVYCLGKNSLRTDADRRALLALTRAMFRHPHDYTKSFFPVELIEPVAPAAARTAEPDRHVPVAK